MSRKLIKELRAGERVKMPLMIKQISLRPFRGRQGYYLSLTLGDQSGQIDCRIWENGEDLYEQYHLGDIVLVEGLIDDYQGQLQIRAFKIETNQEYSIEDFLPTCSGDVTQMLAELKQRVEGMQNRHLKAVLQIFFADEEFLQCFTKAPAAKKMHHAFLGGLLEHTLQVVLTVEKLAEAYTYLDKDLLVAGAILHDIGKIKEFNYAPVIDYNHDGRMLGHIVLGLQMLEEKLNALESFPRDLATRLKHMVTSHHGKYEWQSPKRPKFAEAFVLHQADLLNAELFKFKQVQGKGMSWSSELQRYVYGKSKKNS